MSKEFQMLKGDPDDCCSSQSISNILYGYDVGNIRSIDCLIDNLVHPEIWVCTVCKNNVKSVDGCLRSGLDNLTR